MIHCCLTSQGTYAIVHANILSLKINEAGVAMVPEGRRVFSQMTVLENLMMGAFLQENKDVKKAYLGG